MICIDGIIYDAACYLLDGTICRNEHTRNRINWLGNRGSIFDLDAEQGLVSSRDLCIDTYHSKSSQLSCPCPISVFTVAPLNCRPVALSTHNSPLRCGCFHICCAAFGSDTSLNNSWSFTRVRADAFDVSTPSKAEGPAREPGLPDTSSAGNAVVYEKGERDDLTRFRRIVMTNG